MRDELPLTSLIALRSLEKNREAAQLFRQRQKAHAQELDSKVKLLEAENADWRAKLELLQAENKLIRDQLLYLRSFVGSAVALPELPAKSIEDVPNELIKTSDLGEHDKNV